MGDWEDDIIRQLFTSTGGGGTGNVEKMEDPYQAAKDKESVKWKTKARKDRFPKDGGKPVKASVPGYDKIPWHKSTLTLIGLNPGGYVA